MTGNSKWLIPVGIVVVVILIIVYLSSSKPVPPTVASKEKAWLVNAEPVRIGDHAPDLRLLGSVTSPFNAQLSSTIQADVVAVNVRNGSQVQKGEVLIVLDTQDIQSLVDQRRADLTEVDALIESEYTRYEADQKALKEEQRLHQVAKEAFARQAKLKSSNLIAQERLEQSESEVAQRALSITSREQAIADHPARLAQLTARQSRTKSLLNDALRDLDKSAIKAPFDGTVTETMVSPGDRVQTGQNVVRLFDRSQVEVLAQLPDKYLPDIRQAIDSGAVIQARSTYLSDEIEFTLARLAGASNARSGAIDAFFVPTETSNMVLNSTVKLIAQLPPMGQTFTLPPSAIYGNERVYKIEDSRLVAVPAILLGSQITAEGKTREILSAEGFTEGQALITTQLPNAISGLKVEVRQTNSDRDSGENVDSNVLYNGGDAP